MNLYIKKVINMKVIIGIIFALIPALLMSVPFLFLNVYISALFFIFMFGLGLSVLFGEDKQYDKLWTISTKCITTRKS